MDDNGSYDIGQHIEFRTPSKISPSLKILQGSHLALTMSNKLTSCKCEDTLAAVEDGLGLA